LPFRFAGALAVASCAPTPSGTIELVTGGEPDALTRAPAPTALQVVAVDAKGNATTLATAALPTDSIDLGERDETLVAAVQVSGLDANGKRLVYGEALPVELGALDGLTLDVFIQRTGELARMPSPLSDGRQAPTLGIMVGRYIFVGGGSDPSLATSTQLYDLATFQALSAPPTLPRTPLSIVFDSTYGMLIDASGATSYDFSDSTSKDLPAPAGGSWADVAGGTTLTAADGTSYVVGATRTTGNPTATVLRVDPNGNVSFLPLLTARLGAAAAWVEGRGLVVAGGGGGGAGVEILGAAATSATALPYPTDIVTGAGAAALDSQHVLLAGGTSAAGDDAGTRVIDLGCAASCTAAPWTGSLAPALVRSDAFATKAGDALVVGSDATGATHVYRLTPTSATELPLKVARQNARALELPTGAIAIVGGAGEIESFFP
jgi:hypothetical protein